MFTRDIVPIAKVAIEHSEWNTLDYLLSQLHRWMDSPDRTVAIDAGEIASLLIDIMEKDPSLKPRYVVEVRCIHNYMHRTINYLNSK